LHLALETAQGVFKGLTFLNYYFSHAEFTPIRLWPVSSNSALREREYPRKARRCACSSEGTLLSQGIFLQVLNIAGRQGRVARSPPCPPRRTSRLFPGG
jgi:hypothetical protein